MEEKKKRRNLIQWFKDHPKLSFTIRFCLWLIFAAILPFLFISLRYGIFTKEPKISVTGFGCLALIIVAIFMVTLIRYVYKLINPGFLKQCISGVLSITIPLLIILLVVNAIEQDMALFKQSLIFVLIFETVAIPFNPFPSLIAKKNEKLGTEKYEKISDILWDNFFNRKGDK